MSRLPCRRVVIVAFEGCQSLDVVGPFEVFAGATELLRHQHAADVGYAPLLAAARRLPLRAESGLTLVPAAALVGVARTPIDTLIIAGGAGARQASKDPALLRLVRRVASRARRVASVCTGAFVLAGAGLLDGRRATTHWAFCESLAKRFPAVQVEHEPIYVHDGHVWTSAGVTAGMDLALAMVEEDLGPELARELARWLVVFVRRAGGQSQFSAQLSVQAAERQPLRELQAFIVEHPEVPLDVPALARRVGMSARHFSRVFGAETGCPPALYVERVRVETARRLLETTSRSIEQVASGAGFGTPEALRRAFGRRVGLSPREYRARFGGGPSSSDRITDRTTDRVGDRKAPGGPGDPA